MINNRQNGRRRGRGGNNNNQRGGNPGRPDSGNRIDSRARGNANQLYEKYKNLARDAQMSGDRVNTEYYLQFADHYFRVLSESRLRFEEQNPNAAPQRRIQPVDSFDDFDDDTDYGDEGEPIRAGEQQAASEPRDAYRDQGQRDQGQRAQRDGRDNGGRDNGGRDNNGRDHNGQRQGQPRHDTQRRDDRYEGQRADAGRYDAPRRNGQGGDGQPADASDRDNRFAATGSPIANDVGEDSPDGTEPTPVEGRRRGRPRRVVTEQQAASDQGEGAAPAALDADRLPPSLSLVSAAGEPGVVGEPARPRRRRVRAAGDAPPLGGGEGAGLSRPVRRASVPRSARRGSPGAAPSATPSRAPLPLRARPRAIAGPRGSYTPRD